MSSLMYRSMALHRENRRPWSAISPMEDTPWRLLKKRKLIGRNILQIGETDSPRI
jgi:hypothetical protein